MLKISIVSVLLWSSSIAAFAQSNSPFAPENRDLLQISPPGSLLIFHSDDGVGFDVASIARRVGHAQDWIGPADQRVFFLGSHGSGYEPFGQMSWQPDGKAWHRVPAVDIAEVLLRDRSFADADFCYVFSCYSGRPAAAGMPSFSDDLARLTQKPFLAPMEEEFPALIAGRVSAYGNRVIYPDAGEHALSLPNGMRFQVMGNQIPGALENAEFFASLDGVGPVGPAAVRNSPVPGSLAVTRPNALRPNLRLGSKVASRLYLPELGPEAQDAAAFALTYGGQQFAALGARYDHEGMFGAGVFAVYSGHLIGLTRPASSASGLPSLDEMMRSTRTDDPLAREARGALLASRGCGPEIRSVLGMKSDEELNRIHGYHPGWCNVSCGAACPNSYRPQFFGRVFGWTAQPGSEYDRRVTP